MEERLSSQRATLGPCGPQTRQSSRLCEFASAEEGKFNTRSYASPEWRATANPGTARRDDGDNVHAHTLLGPERRVSACWAPTKEANERTEVTEKTEDPSKEATERKPGRDHLKRDYPKSAEFPTTFGPKT